MKRGLIFLFFLTLGSLSTTFANEPVNEPLAAPALSMPIGEHLVYKITWLWIPVGIGELWVKEKTMLAGREVILIEGALRTNAVLSKIFPIHDKAYSWVDAQTLESIQFEKEINEIIIKTHEKMVFDAAAGTGHFENVKTGENSEFKIRVPVQDVFSAFYWIRRQTLVLGEMVQTRVVADQKEWALEVHVLSRETVEIHDKKIETLRLEPISRVEGMVKRGKAWFYVTDDAFRIPLRIVYKAPFGKMVGTLIEPEP